MANKKEKNEITAEELIGKLGRSAGDDSFADRLSAFDVPDGDEPTDTDDALDISELMRKYLPEYEEGKDIDGDTPVQLSFDAPLEATEDGEDTSKNEISFADGIFSEYDISSDTAADADEMNGSRETDGEIESERTRRFLSSLLHGGGEEADRDDAWEKDEPAPETEETEEEDVIDSLDGLFTPAGASEDENDGGSADEADDALYDVPARESASDNEEPDEYDDWDDEAKKRPDPDDEYDEYDDEPEKRPEPDDEYDEWEDDVKDDDSGKEVDPTDINLMIAFDIDSDDEETKNRAKALGDKLETSRRGKTRKKFVLDRPEYVDKSQTAGIRDEFRKKKNSLTIRALLCFVCAAGLFVFENITTLTRLFTGSAQQFTGAVDPALYPVVYIMVSLQITLLACLCAIPEIIDGVKHLIKGVPIPSSLTALLAVVSIVYSAVLCNIIKSPDEPVMFGFVVAMSAFFTLIGEKLNNKREIMNFRVIAGKKPKNVVRHLDDEESECESSAFPSSDRGCDVMKIERTDFISNFFSRLGEPDRSVGTVMTFIMGVSIVVGIMFGVFAALRSGNDTASVWRVVFAAIFLLAPASVQLAFSYPFYRANRAAVEYDSAIIGDVSLDEYSNASIISFDDKNVFPSYSVKVQNIRIYNNARIDRVLYYASSVFATAGGPLQDVFEIATKDMGTSDNVHIFDTASGFLATQVDGVNIIFGSYNALTSRGLEIPENAALDDVDFSDDLSIMYMFRESKLVAKMYIKYDMDEDIDVILKQFAGDGLYVCVRTYDPNIDEKMVAKKLGVKHVPLKVVRYVSPDEVGRHEDKVDSGLVTSSSPKSLLQIISYCEKVKRARKTNTALGVLSVIISVALMLLIVLSGSIDSLSSAIIALHQLLWIIPMIIASKVYIR